MFSMINEHGRYAMPVLSYTSDARFSFSALEIETQSVIFPASVVKYAVGDFLLIRIFSRQL